CAAGGPRAPQPRPAPPPPTPRPPLEALSDSEIRVLRYLPTNLTGPEIAGEFYVSLNTSGPICATSTSSSARIAAPTLLRAPAPLACWHPARPGATPRVPAEGRAGFAATTEEGGVTPVAAGGPRAARARAPRSLRAHRAAKRCSEARSGSGPVSTVSPPLARASRVGKAERIVSPRWPRTRMRYRCGGGSLSAPVICSPP